MPSEDLYSLSIGTDVAARMLGIDPAVALERAGFGANGLAQAARGVTARQYFDVWNAMVELAGRDDLVEYLGVAIARGPVVPVFLALSCAPNLESGLHRLSRFKSLIGPVRMRVMKDADQLAVEYQSADPSVEMPATMGALHVVFSVEKARGLMAHPLRPLAVTLKAPEAYRRSLGPHLGVVPDYGETTSVRYALKDAQRPFIGGNDRLWADLERDLEQQLMLRGERSAMSARVHSALLDLFTRGRSGAEEVCRHIGVSRSTMQRRLREEGRSFQDVLDGARKDLAIRYLSKSVLSNAEVAYMLAYQDQSSFFRSFRRWTGTTPDQFRQSLNGTQPLRASVRG
jgi:AraC-like DNA-binding protein